MMGAGERHPLQVMAMLHNHYVRLARLDGVDARTEADAAEALGIKPGFPAKKALGSTSGSAAAGSSGRSSCSPRPTSTCGAPRSSPDDS